MNPRLALACALSLLIAVPAFAQEGDEEAKNTEGTEQVEEEKKAVEKKSEEKAEDAKEDEDEETKDAEAADAEEVEAEEPKAEEPAAEEVKAEEPKAEEPAAEEPKAEEPAAEEPKAEEPKVEEVKTEAAATTEAASTGVSSGGETASLGATADVASEDTKPWSVSGVLSQSLGTSAFVKDQQVGRAAYSYAVILGGAYQIMDLLEGKLSASARWSFDQNLTVTGNDSFKRLWNPRDLLLGLNGASLFTEKTTGIKFGGATSFTLPTSRQAIAADRVLTWTLNGSATRTFEDLGPGNLSLSFSESFSAFAGPKAPTSSLAFCDSVSRHDSGLCYSNLTNPSVSFMHALAASYAIGDLSFAFSFRWIQTLGHVLNDSTLSEGARISEDMIGSSPNANPDAFALSTTTWTTLSASYAVTDALAVAGGFSTAQSPIFQSGANSRAVRFPFWDTQAPANNHTNFFVDVSYSY